FLKPTALFDHLVNEIRSKPFPSTGASKPVEMHGNIAKKILLLMNLKNTPTNQLPMDEPTDAPADVDGASNPR
mgnify:CR=1